MNTQSNKNGALLAMVHSTVTAIQDAQNSVLNDSDSKHEDKAKAESQIWMTAMAFVVLTGELDMEAKVTGAFLDATNAHANATIDLLDIVKAILGDDPRGYVNPVTGEQPWVLR